MATKKKCPKLKLSDRIKQLSQKYQIKLQQDHIKAFINYDYLLTQPIPQNLADFVKEYPDAAYWIGATIAFHKKAIPRIAQELQIAGLSEEDVHNIVAEILLDQNTDTAKTYNGEKAEARETIVQKLNEVLYERVYHKEEKVYLQSHNLQNQSASLSTEQQQEIQAKVDQQINIYKGIILNQSEIIWKNLPPEETELTQTHIIEKRIIERIVAEGLQKGLNEEDIHELLLITKQNTGFNPFTEKLLKKNKPAAIPPEKIEEEFVEERISAFFQEKDLQSQHVIDSDTKVVLPEISNELSNEINTLAPVYPAAAETSTKVLPKTLPIQEKKKTQSQLTEEEQPPILSEDDDPTPIKTATSKIDPLLEDFSATKIQPQKSNVTPSLQPSKTDETTEVLLEDPQNLDVPSVFPLSDQTNEKIKPSKEISEKLNAISTETSQTEDEVDLNLGASDLPKTSAVKIDQVTKVNQLLEDENNFIEQESITDQITALKPIETRAEFKLTEISKQIKLEEPSKETLESQHLIEELEEISSIFPLSEESKETSVKSADNSKTELQQEIDQTLSSSFEQPDHNLKFQQKEDPQNIIGQSSDFTIFPQKQKSVQKSQKTKIKPDPAISQSKSKPYQPLKEIPIKEIEEELEEINDIFPLIPEEKYQSNIPLTPPEATSSDQKISASSAGTNFFKTQHESIDDFNNLNHEEEEILHFTKTLKKSRKAVTELRELLIIEQPITDPVKFAEKLTNSKDAIYELAYALAPVLEKTTRSYKSL